MEPWVWLVASLIVSVVGGAVKLRAFTVECRLRRDVERMNVTLLEQAQLTGDAHDVKVMGAALAHVINARGPLPAFRLQPAVALTATNALGKLTDRPRARSDT